MNDRIHACLDGELARDDLSPAERARLAEIEEALDSVVDRLRAVPTPDLTAAVMRRLPPREAPAPAVPAPAAAGEPAWRRALEWLWNPRPVRLAFRPAYALAGAMLAAFALLRVPQLAAPAGDAVPASAPAPVRMAANVAEPAPLVYVQFRLQAEGARDVAIAGTFTGWKPAHVLRQTQPGVWTALLPIPAGVHDYAFVVDGEKWIPDPNAPQVDDSFGGRNSRISLPPPGPA